MHIGIGDPKHLIGFVLYLTAGRERSILAEILKVGKPSKQSPTQASLHSLTITVIVVTASTDHAGKQASLLETTQILTLDCLSDYAGVYYGGGEEDLHACIFLA